ncbi:hypothetical protein L2726_004619 [Vibrio parahaemolyticus]|nr:hypothetical protein [Vibrio parahaemolyticus]EIT7127008.1 hypothetical protein [Vibrio parahaemolyticus]EIT7132020.1 hypothetical protein [Vibrio parahaemolyticus]EIZ4252457.1 hypothetical protein [Vibrio parahaemolyticus]EJG0971340.1 hypothetical protein [Vibrio parahaemolyticus]
MSNAQKVTKWLKDNTNLSWTRTGGDEPPIKQDRLYINRSEGYEIRDFILRYYEECNLAHKDDNYKISLKKINSYKSGEKVKTQDLLDHLKAKSTSK